MRKKALVVIDIQNDITKHYRVPLNEAYPGHDPAHMALTGLVPHVFMGQ